MTSSKLSRVSTVDALAAALADEILGGRLAPGQALRENQIADRFGVSRNSVRAALQDLSASGIVRREPHRGTFVPVFSEAEIRDLYLMRLALESEAARQIVRRGLDLEPARQAVEELRRVDANASWSAVVARDLDVHTAIISAVGSPYLSRTFDALPLEQRLMLGQLELEYPRPERELAEQHAELVEAIASADEQVAVDAVRRHLDLSAAEVVAARRRGHPT